MTKTQVALIQQLKQGAATTTDAGRTHAPGECVPIEEHRKELENLRNELIDDMEKQVKAQRLSSEGELDMVKTILDKQYKDLQANFRSLVVEYETVKEDLEQQLQEQRDLAKSFEEQLGSAVSEAFEDK